MVGGLVEQQHVGLGHQGAGERRAARLAARQLGGIFGAVELHLGQKRGDPVVAGAERIGQACRDIVGDAGMAGEIRLLRQGRHGGAGLGEARAAIGDRLARQDLQQGRFAGAVAADQAQPLAGRDAELDAVEDGLVAQVVADAGEGQEGWFGHFHESGRALNGRSCPHRQG